MYRKTGNKMVARHYEIKVKYETMLAGERVSKVDMKFSTAPEALNHMKKMSASYKRSNFVDVYKDLVNGIVKLRRGQAEIVTLSMVPAYKQVM